MGQTKLSKIINGRQALKLNESEALKEAISFLSVEPRFAERNGGAPEPEGSKLIDRIIGKRPSGGRPAELVFLLTDRNYMDFQLDQRLLEELRQALRDMAGS